MVSKCILSEPMQKILFLGVKRYDMRLLIILEIVVYILTPTCYNERKREHMFYNSRKREGSYEVRSISVQDAEDACLSFFGEIVMKAYDEIPWGEGTENGVIIESDYSVESQSGAVAISYTLMDEPNAGTHIVINFVLEDDKVGVSEVLVDGVKQDLPEDAKDSVLVWLLLDANYQG